MSVYLIATIEVKGAGFAAFTQAMGEVVALVEGAGWKLAGAYLQRTGQLNTVIDVWELDDFNHMNAGFAAIAASPRFPAISAALQETIARETLTFADRLVYPAPV